MNPEVSKCLKRALDAQYEFKPNEAFVALYDAISVLNEQGNLNPPSPQSSPHPEPIKPLTLADLKRQVDLAVTNPNYYCPTNPTLPEGVIGYVGDFEIRRRK